MGAREVLNVLVIIFCIIAISVAMYDLFRLNQVHNNAINRCNDFYHKEFAAKCVLANPMDNQFANALNFTLEFEE